MFSYVIVHFDQKKSNGLKDLLDSYIIEEENDIIPLESYINLGKLILKNSNDFDDSFISDNSTISLESYISLGNCISELSMTSTD